MYLIEKLTYLILFLVIFDPKSKILKMNEIISASYMMVYIYLLIKKKYKLKKNVIIFYSFYFLIPVFYALIIFMLTKNQEYNSYYIQQNIRRVIFALIIFPMTLVNYNKLKQNLMKVLKINLIFILFLFIIQFIFIYFYPEFGDKIYWWGREKEIFLLHSMKILGVKIPSIFTGNILLFVFLLANSLFDEKNYFYSILSFLILLQSNTAANALSGILIVIYWIYSKLNKKMNLKIRYLTFLFLGLVMIIVIKNYIFSSEDTGNRIKYLHMISYFNYWEKNPIKFFLGAGLGSGIYALAYKKIVYLTEIFYFEIIRIYGFIIFLIILLNLLKLLNKMLIKNNEWLAISFLSYLCISGTNPYLFGITGSLIISIIFCLLYNDFNIEEL